MKQTFIQLINYLNLISALLLAAASIYYYPMQKLAFIVFFSSYFIEIFAEQKWKNIRLDKKTVYFSAMALFFILALLYQPFESSNKYFQILLEKRFPLLGVSIVAIFGVNKLYKLNYFLNTFIISAVVAIVYLAFVRMGVSEVLNNEDWQTVFAAHRIEYVNTHMVFNFYLNISLISIWYILTRSWRKTIWWKRYLYIAAMTVIFSALSISDGRSGFAMGILLMLCFLFFELWKRRKALGIVVGLLIPFLLIGIAGNHKRMSEKALETEPRWFLWESALSVIKQKPVLGHGISDAQVEFDLTRPNFETEEYRHNWRNNKRLDSHSQYLQTTMEFGIFGLIILLFLYVVPILIADKNRRMFAILLLVVCAYQSVFDLFITGNFSTLFGILVILILCVENNIAVEKSKTPEIA
jgi:O-antigen ligase